MSDSSRCGWHLQRRPISCWSLGPELKEAHRGYEKVAKDIKRPKDSISCGYTGVNHGACCRIGRFGLLFGVGLLLRSDLFRAGFLAPEPKEAHAGDGNCFGAWKGHRSPFGGAKRWYVVGPLFVPGRFGGVS